MSKVEELLAKYNSNGISTIKLADILDYEQPSKYIVSSSEYDDNYDIPVLTAGQSFILGYTDEKDGVYKASKNNPTIIFDDFTTGHHWVDFDFKIKSSAMKMLRLKNNKSLLRYIFHSMALINYVPTEHSRQWISKYSQFEIPLPHIKVQEEIVKILDSFTNLIDALNEELSLRQKQFEYYREKLLTFDESNYVKISSICKRIVSGGTPKTTIDRYYQGNIPWLRTEEVDFCYVYETKKHISEEAIANSSTKMIPVNCVIIAMYGATAAKCCINKIPLCTNQACCNLEIDDTLALYKFVFFNICKEYEKLKSLGEGSQNNISGQKIKDYRIPIPSLAIQQSIVEKLDAFESLISSLKEEIALRQKQYEYYREKLLTFD